MIFNPFILIIKCLGFFFIHYILTHIENIRLYEVCDCEEKTLFMFSIYTGASSFFSVSAFLAVNK